MTPLILAVKQNHHDLTRYLVTEAKAEVNLQASEKVGSIMLLVYIGKMDVYMHPVKLLVCWLECPILCYQNWRPENC